MQCISILFTPPRIGDIGGVEAHTLALANLLTKMGNRVSIACADEKTGSLGQLRKHTELNLLKTAFKIQNTNITPGLPLALVKANPDIIHTMIPTPWSADWSAFIGKIRGKKVVVTIHSDLYSPSAVGGIITKFYVETFYRVLLAFADRIIVVNPDFMKTFVHTRHVLRRFKEKIVSIPNGVDTGVFSPAARKDGGKSKKNILFVSVLDEYHEFKGLGYLIEAIPKVIEKVPNVLLTVVGEGPLKEKYKKLAAELQVEKHVNFVGAKQNMDLPKFYSSSDVFVLPSVDTEAFGIVLLEAMACGTPVVTTKYAGMQDKIIKNKCGFIVPSRNSPALAGALIKILTDKKLARSFGKNARKLVEDNYSWDKVVQETVNAYVAVMRQ